MHKNKSVGSFEVFVIIPILEILPKSNTALSHVSKKILELLAKPQTVNLRKIYFFYFFYRGRKSLKNQPSDVIKMTDYSYFYWFFLPLLLSSHLFLRRHVADY